MSTYSIYTMGGRHAWWLPSEEAARERWLENHARRVKEHEEDGDEPPGEVSFVESFVDDQGEPCPRHIAVYEGDDLVAAIWPESAAWPEAGGPPLVMWADRPSDCRHGVLGCEMDDSGPVITCSGCGTKWGPAR